MKPSAAPRLEAAPLFSRWAARLLFLVNVASLFFMTNPLGMVFAYIFSNPLAILITIGAIGAFALVILPELYEPIRDFVRSVGDYSYYLLAGGAVLTVIGMVAGGDFSPLGLVGMFAQNTVIAELALATLMIVSATLRSMWTRNGRRGDIYEP